MLTAIRAVKDLCAIAFILGVLYAAAPLYPGVVEIPSVDALVTANFIGFSHFRAPYYHAANDQGGGDFYLVSSCTVDHIVCFQDLANNYYLRQFTGTVHIAWGGACDAATSTAYNNAWAGCDSATLAQAAVVASGVYGNKHTTTDGRSLYLSAPLDVPAGYAWDCGGPVGGFHKQGGINAVLYYQEGNSLIHDGNNEITVEGSMQQCFGRDPNYRPRAGVYAIPFVTADDLTEYQHTWHGTGFHCIGEAAVCKDLKAFGFNVCFENDTAPRSTLAGDIGGCNSTYWVRKQKGGMQHENYQAVDMLGHLLKFSRLALPILSIAPNGTDATIRVAIDNASGNLQYFKQGYKVWVEGIVNALQSAQIGTVSARGDLNQNADDPKEIDNVTGTAGSDINLIHQGDSINDGKNGSNCFPAGDVVADIQIEIDGTATVEGSLNTDPSCTDSNHKINFGSGATGNVGANGEWTIAAVNISGGAYMDLLASNAAGPSFSSGVVWNAGHKLIGLPDTSNVGSGQFLVAPGCNTPPFCAAPSGYTTMAAITTSNGASIGTTTGHININTGSITGWPTDNICLWDSEVVECKPDASGGGAINMNVVTRGLRCTTVVTHANSSTLTPAAPMVTQVDPVDHTISSNILPTASAGNGTAQLINDQTLCGTVVGAVVLDAQQPHRGANISAGPVPGTEFNATANCTNGTQSLVLTGDYALIWAKANEGMSVSDVTNPNSIQSGDYIDLTPTSNAIHLHQACAAGISGDLLAFTGAGFPGLVDLTHASQPWLGNVDTPGELLGGTQQGDGLVQGVISKGAQLFAHSRSVRMIDAPATTYGAFVMGTNQDDPYAVNVWMSGKSGTKTGFCNGRFGGNNAILMDNTLGLLEAATFCGIQISGAVYHGGGNLTLDAMTQSGVGLSPVIMHEDTAADLTLSGNDLSKLSLTEMSDTGRLNIYTAASHFADANGDSGRYTPQCGASGCTSLVGLDNAMAVALNSATTSVNVVLGGDYRGLRLNCPFSPNSIGSLAKVTTVTPAPDTALTDPLTVLTITLVSGTTKLTGGCRVAQ